MKYYIPPPNCQTRYVGHLHNCISNVSLYVTVIPFEAFLFPTWHGKQMEVIKRRCLSLLCFVVSLLPYQTVSMWSNKDTYSTVTSPGRHSFFHISSHYNVWMVVWPNNKGFTSHPHCRSFVKEITQWLIDSTHKWSVTRKACLWHGVSWHISVDDLGSSGAFSDLSGVTLYTLTSLMLPVCINTPSCVAETVFRVRYHVKW